MALFSDSSTNMKLISHLNHGGIVDVNEKPTPVTLVTFEMDGSLHL